MLKFPTVNLRNSIFLKMIFTYLIVIIPIIILSLYLYSWSYKNASEEVSRSSETQIKSWLEKMTREIDWMELQLFSILEDNGVHRSAVTWSLMNDVEKKNELNYILDRLTSVKNSSSYIGDVYIHMRTVDKSISALTNIQPFDVTTFEYLNMRVTNDNDSYVTLNNAPQLVAAKHSGTKGDQPLYIVQIAFDTDELLSMLEGLQLYDGSGSFLLWESAGYMLGSGENAELLMREYQIKGDKLTSPMMIELSGRRYQINQAQSPALGMTIVNYVPEEVVKRPLNRFNLWAWLYAVVSLLAIIVYSYTSYKRIHKPLLLLVKSFRRMENGDLDIRIEHHQQDEFGYLYDRFNQMTDRLKELIDQNYKQRMMVQKAELKQLQSQINPHFLYNSLFILNSMAKVGDLERIERFTLMIGEYFRFITRNGEDFVRLWEETKHSRMYTEIQKLRFSRRIKVQFDELPPDLEKVLVPKLIIQPLIENAYEHSLEQQDEGFLRVSFQRRHQTVRIIVENSGYISDEQLEELKFRLKANPDDHEMTGMINIHRRLILAYGKGSGLLLSRSDLGGLRVVIQIILPQGEMNDVSTVDRG